MQTFVEKVQVWGNIRLTSCRNFVEVGEKLWKNVQCGNFSGISFEKLYLEFYFFLMWPKVNSAVLS